MIAGATGIGNRGGLSAVTFEFITISEEEVAFSELVNVSTVDLVSTNFEFRPEAGETDGEFFLSDKTGVESKNK